MLDESQYTTKLQEGIYQLYNARSGTLAGISENYVIDFTPHSSEDHLWEFTSIGPGYTIRSVSTGLYISFEGKMENGSKLVVRDVPAVWIVRTHNFVGLTRIHWPHSTMLFDLDCGNNYKVGRRVHMFNLHEGVMHQTWKMKLIRSSTTSEKRVEETRRVGGLNDEPLLITTTVTTVTKVVRGRPITVEEDSSTVYGSDDG